MAKRKLTVVSLFSGSMGLDLGMDGTSRYRILACLEKDPTFCATIKLNQREGRLPKRLKVFEGGIEVFDPNKIMQDFAKTRPVADCELAPPMHEWNLNAGRFRNVVVFWCQIAQNPNPVQDTH